MKERILLHLSDFSRFSDTYEVPEEVTQAGLAHAAGIRVQHASQYVRPLVEEGFLTEHLRHVRRKNRRQKAYVLTEGGRAKATSLRTELLAQLVPVRKGDGSMKRLPLARLWQDQRHGNTFLGLIRAWEAKGYLNETPLGASFVDFTSGTLAATPLYGREEEVAQLLQALERAPIVAVTGVAGIGKTTLGSKVCTALRGTRSLYWRRIRPWDTTLDLASSLAAFLAAAGRNALSGYLASAEVAQLGRIEELLSIDFTEFESLLIFDDVHTASADAEAFLSVLGEALLRQRGSSVLVLSRTLPGFYRLGAKLAGSVFELALRGLDLVSATAFLTDAGVPSVQVEWFNKVAGGNPLFLRILAQAVATGTTERARYTIERYVAEEIEAYLAEDERRCMELGSLYEVPVPPAGFLLGAKHGMSTITSLRAKGLVDETDEGRLVVHDFLRHYFESSLTGEERAGLVQIAIPWLVGEADKAEADRNPRGAIALLANASIIGVNREDRRGALERLGQLRYLLGDLPAAVETFRAALTLAKDPQVRARLHLRLANALYPFRRDDDTEAEIDRGLEVLPAGPSLLAAWLQQIKGKVAFDRGDFTGASEEFTLPLRWMPELPEDPELLGLLLEWKAILYVYDPSRRDLALAESEFRDSVEVLKKARSRWLPRPFEGLALVSLETGRIEEALSYLDEAQKHRESHHYPLVARNIEFLRAWALAECVGDYDAAESLYHEAAEVAEAAYERYRLDWFDRYFADLYWHQGRLDEARESLANFLRKASGRMIAENEVQNLARMARLSAGFGDRSEAEAYLAKAQGAAGRVPPKAVAYYLEWATGVLRTIDGDLSRAGASFARTIRLQPPTRNGTHVQEHLASGCLRGEMLLDYARLLSAEGDRDQARLVILEARDEFARLGRRPLQLAADLWLESHAT